MGLIARLAAGLLLLLSSTAALAEERPSMRAAWVDTAPVIDGKLDDPAWTKATPVGGFVERKPALRAAPADATIVRILFDSEALYFGIRCEDSDPDAVRANVRTRDTLAMFADDAISVKLDVKSDKRTTLGFVMNPGGARVDYRGVNEDSFRVEFDAIWQGAATRDEGGWSAEFRLPWAALELDPTAAPARIGLNFSRDHPRRNATYDWVLMPPPFSPVSASLYGDLLGLEVLGDRLEASGLEPGLLKSWHVTAYGLGGFDHVAADDDATEATVYDPVYNGGLDGRVDFGRLQVDLTLNTDFAQVDLDDQVTNLDRFSLFLPEKRDFFLSSMELFQFGIGGLAQLLHTRQIGLHDGEEVPIAEGLKLTARPIDDLQLSVLQVTTMGTDDLPATSHGVFRSQLELGGGSNVGVMLTHRQSLESLDDRNLVIGVDGAWRGGGSPMLIESFAALSVDRDPSADTMEALGGMVGALAMWRDELIQPFLGYLYIHPDFAADLGFIHRTDMHGFRAGLTLEPRPTSLGFEKIQVYLEGGAGADAELSQLLDWDVSSGFQLHGASGFGAKLDATFKSEQVLDEFDVGDRVIPPGQYDRLTSGLWLWTPYNKPVHMTGFIRGGDYFEGKILSGALHLNVRPFEALRTYVGGQIDHTTFDDGTGFDAITINSWAALDFTTDLGMKVQAGWNHLEERFRLLSRLRWTYLPGSDLFFVYQMDLGTDTMAPTFQSLQVKATFRYPWE